MGALDQTFANAILEASWDTAVASVRLATAPIKGRLMTANGSATSAGTQLGASGGYSSGGATVTAATASGGSKASNAAYTITNMPTASCAGLELWDAIPARKWWAAFAGGNVSTVSGDTLSIASGALATALP